MVKLEFMRGLESNAEEGNAAFSSTPLNEMNVRELKNDEYKTSTSDRLRGRARETEDYASAKLSVRSDAR
jgi:hypothetical protein